MKMKMPLELDRVKQQLRNIDFECPDDLTQEEFWNFVHLIGVSLFGEEHEDEAGEHSAWNIHGSFQHFVR